MNFISAEIIITKKITNFGHTLYDYHSDDTFNIIYLIVICSCITLIIIAIFLGFVLLQLQGNKIKAKKSERDEVFKNKIALEDRNNQQVIARETRIREEEELRKRREFVIALIDKLKVKTETTSTKSEKEPEIKTDKKEEVKVVEEKINEEFLKLLFESLKDIIL